MVLSIILAVVGLVVGSGASLVYSKQKQEAIKQDVDKEKQKSIKESEKLIAQSKEEASKLVEEAKREEQVR